ncbi:hypothetical protein Y032_0048g1689 [Ancylostoma ceylanicum]|uniref:Uncharacterized protein n=1 Tax=Ancylostoma ceylanicum TaxID=53326 RepID=A0A016UBD1_9BILA|nr:hypothetical protein Y032_0048g1689 [Ancylostoma ceylanicum]
MDVNLAEVVGARGTPSLSTSSNTAPRAIKVARLSEEYSSSRGVSLYRLVAVMTKETVECSGICMALVTLSNRSAPRLVKQSLQKEQQTF